MCDFARCERAADRLETVDGLVDAGNDRSDITLRLSTCKHLGVRIVDLRVYPAGANSVAPNILLRKVQRDTLREAHDTVLRRGVDRKIGLADKAVHARNIDDRAATLGPHYWNRSQAAIHHALEIHGKGAINDLVGDRAQ